MICSAGSEVVVGIELGDLWDWSELEDEDISDLLSHVVEFIGAGISDDVTDIGVDLGDVHEGVGESFFEKSDWILEDSRPDLDSFDVWSHTSAISKISIDGTKHFSDNRDTSNDAHGVFLFEISNSFYQHWSKNFLILEAWFD